MEIKLKNFIGRHVEWISGAKGNYSRKRGKVIYANEDGYPDGLVPPIEFDLRNRPYHWDSLEEYEEYRQCSPSRKRFDPYSKKYLIVRVKRGKGKKNKDLVDYYYAPNLSVVRRVARHRKPLSEYYAKKEKERLGQPNTSILRVTF
jgi:hypothetical protein